MFAIIKTNGATEIIINIPHEGSDKSLPALAGMLENNSVFINKGWREVKIVKPEMNIALGDSLECDSGDEDIIIKAKESESVLDDSFVFATPEVLASHSKALIKRDEDIGKKNTEIIFLKSENERLKNQLEALINPELSEED